MGEQLKAAGEPAWIELDPLPAQPDQRLLQLGEPGELLGVEALLAQRHLPLVVDERLLPHTRTPGDDARLPAPAGAQAGAETCGGTAPPAR